MTATISTGTLYEQRLGYATRRAVCHPAFMASRLDRYRQKRHWSWLELGQWLGVPTLVHCYRLALCLVPMQPQRIALLASYTACTPDLLSQVLVETGLYPPVG